MADTVVREAVLKFTTQGAASANQAAAAATTQADKAAAATTAATAANSKFAENAMKFAPMAAGSFALITAALDSTKTAAQRLDGSLNAVSGILVAFGPMGAVGAVALTGLRLIAGAMNDQLQATLDLALGSAETWKQIKSDLTAEYALRLKIVALDEAQNQDVAAREAEAARKEREANPLLARNMNAPSADMWEDIRSGKLAREGRAKQLALRPAGPLVPARFSAPQDVVFGPDTSGFEAAQQAAFGKRLEAAGVAGTMSAQTEMAKRGQGWEVANEAADRSNQQISAALGIAGSGLKQLSDGWAAYASSVVKSGKISASAVQMLASQTVVSMGQMAVQQGTMLLIASALPATILGPLGLAGASGAGGVGAALIAFGLAAQVAGGQMAPHGGGGAGGKVGGGSNMVGMTGSPFAAQQQQKQEFTVYLHPGLLTDAVVRTSREREGQMGMMRLNTGRG